MMVYYLVISRPDNVLSVTGYECRECGHRSIKLRIIQSLHSFIYQIKVSIQEITIENRVRMNRSKIDSNIQVLHSLHLKVYITFFSSIFLRESPRSSRKRLRNNFYQKISVQQNIKFENMYRLHVEYYNV
jgi:hypothetical protein